MQPDCIHTHRQTREPAQCRVNERRGGRETAAWLQQVVLESRCQVSEDFRMQILKSGLRCKRFQQRRGEEVESVSSSGGLVSGSKVRLASVGPNTLPSKNSATRLKLFVQRPVNLASSSFMSDLRKHYKAVGLHPDVTLLRQDCKEPTFSANIRLPIQY